MAFGWFLAPFWAPFLVIFHVFCITFSSMEFVLIFHWFWDEFWSHFWCFFDDFPVRALTLQNLEFWIPSEYKRVFSLLKNMNFHDFPLLFRYQFLHCFLMRFCIDFGSILAPVGIHFHVFSRLFFWWFFGWYFYWFLIKNGSQKPAAVPTFFFTFSILFRRGCFERFLGSFCHPLGSILVVFGIFLAHFG